VGSSREPSRLELCASQKVRAQPKPTSLTRAPPNPIQTYFPSTDHISYTRLLIPIPPTNHYPCCTRWARG